MAKVEAGCSQWNSGGIQKDNQANQQEERIMSPNPKPAKPKSRYTPDGSYLKNFPVAETVGGAN
jgi:hypothetical protein